MGRSIVALLVAVLLGVNTGCEARRPKQFMRPLMQLKGSGSNFFEEAYQATYGVNGSSVQQAIQQVDQLVALLSPAQDQPGSVQAPSHPPILELADHPNGQELLQAALQLADTELEMTALTGAMMALSHGLSHSVGPKQAFPVLRRLIVGALIKQRAAKGRFQDSLVRLQADSLLLHLFLLHRRAVAARGVIEYTHVSKSGGTNMCVTSEDSGCATEGYDPSTNCKVAAFDDWPHWLTAAGHRQIHKALTGQDKDSTYRWWVNFDWVTQRQGRLNCSARAAYMRSKGWVFYAQEFAAPEGSPCSELTQLMLWRHPMARMKSHLHFMQYQYDKAYKIQDWSVFERNSSFWRAFLPVGTDNQYIRSLLGIHMWFLPLESITPEHVRQAKLKAVQQDVLLVLENTTFNDLAFKVGLGWPQGLRQEMVRKSDFHKELHRMPADMHVLEQLNQPDVEVYDFGVQLAAVDALVWQAVSSMSSRLGLGLGRSERCGYVTLPVRQRHHVRS